VKCDAKKLFGIGYAIFISLNYYQLFQLSKSQKCHRRAISNWNLFKFIEFSFVTLRANGTIIFKPGFSEKDLPFWTRGSSKKKQNQITSLLHNYNTFPVLRPSESKIHPMIGTLIKLELTLLKWRCIVACNDWTRDKGPPYNRTI